MAFICNKILKCIRCDGPPRLRHFHSSVRTNIGWFSAISEACLCCKNAQPLRQRFAAFYNRERFLEAGKVLAVDINEGRLRILEEAAEQLGVSNIVSTLCCDLRNYTVSILFECVTKAFVTHLLSTGTLIFSLLYGNVFPSPKL